jgi:prophage regulatory protein
MSKEIEIDRLLRLPQVLELVPVGKSHWWAGCANGRYPKPLKLSPGITVWRATDIQALIQDLSMEDVA